MVCELGAQPAVSLGWNAAVTLWVPAGNAEVDKLAAPCALVATIPTEASTLKVTVPARHADDVGSHRGPSAVLAVT